MTAFPWPAALYAEPMTYRQMDHWIHRFPDHFSDSAKPGRPGIVREFTVHDVQVLTRIARLVDAGLRLDVAGQLPDRDSGYYRLTPHVTMRVSMAAR